MKTKTKMLALLEIAIVLCSVLLVAIPAIVAEQNQAMQKVSASEVTTASEDDYVLGIYGNANEDDTIDMGDVVYTKLAIFGKKSKTELCDAKYDGRINVLDVIQTKLIILGKEKELTFVDQSGYYPGEIVTIKKPIKRIVLLNRYTAEALKAIGAEDKVVGVGQQVVEDEVFFPELSKLPSVGSHYPGPDFEAILELKPDLLIGYMRGFGTSLEELEPHTQVIYFLFSKPVGISEEFAKLGYILDKEDEAKEYADFVKGYMDTINDKVDGISEEDKQRVYLAWWGTYTTCNKRAGGGQICAAMAGGINIAGDQPSGEVDPEWVIEQNPDVIIVRATGSAASSGYDEDNPTEAKALRDNIMNRLELPNVNAVKDGRVYVIAADITARPSYFVAVTYFAKWFYPDLDLDPQAIHQEYLHRFQHIDFNVYEHGVFAYPLPK